MSVVFFIGGAVRAVVNCISITLCFLQDFFLKKRSFIDHMDKKTLADRLGQVTFEWATA